MKTTFKTGDKVSVKDGRGGTILQLRGDGAAALVELGQQGVDYETAWYATSALSRPRKAAKK